MCTKHHAHWISAMGPMQPFFQWRTSVNSWHSWHTKGCCTMRVKCANILGFVHLIFGRVPTYASCQLADPGGAHRLPVHVRPIAAGQVWQSSCCSCVKQFLSQWRQVLPRNRTISCEHGCNSWSLTLVWCVTRTIDGEGRES